MFTVHRHPKNPILKPTQESWESLATFNWSPLQHSGTTYVCYRAMSQKDLLMGPGLSFSVIGAASSLNGQTFSSRHPLIVPDQEWDKYGCEDPRVTRIENKNYVFYTALSDFPFDYTCIKSAVAIVNDDFTEVIEKHLLTPFNAKAMTVFPQKIGGKYLALLTVHPDQPPSAVCLAEFDSLEQMWDPNYWQKWYANYKDYEFKLLRNDKDHVEIGAAPILTDRGWLLIYSHIQDYFSQKPIFGIEAMILDKYNPRKMVARTEYPLMVPEEHYEKYGEIPNIAFPSGVLVNGENLEIYYGAADTYGCIATLKLSELLDDMTPSRAHVVKRIPVPPQPVLTPIAANAWEAKAVFNPSTLEIDGKVHMLYRAMSHDNTSTMGYAILDEDKVIYRCPVPVYVPRFPFEYKLIPNGNSGCEDPRLTMIDDKIYMCYTAYNGKEVPRVAITSISKEDFLAQKWNWAEPVLISPPGIDDKDACIFPQKFAKGYLVIHRMQHRICGDYIDSLDFKTSMIDRCEPIIGPRPGMWDDLKVGLNPTPILTEKGWLMFYHGVSHDGIYRLGAALLDKDDPITVLSRTTDFIMEPELDYELFGQVNNVVFPCGSVLIRDTLYLYYGAADSVIGVAKANLTELLERLS